MGPAHMSQEGLVRSERIADRVSHMKLLWIPISLRVGLVAGANLEMQMNVVWLMRQAKRVVISISREKAFSRKIRFSEEERKDF